MASRSTSKMACSKISDFASATAERLSENKTAVAAVAAGATVAAGAALLYRRHQNAVPTEGIHKVLPSGAYDAVIVGAGPSGSVMGYYVAKGGGKVALLEKATFPRGEWVGGC